MLNTKKEDDDRPALLIVVWVFLFGKFVKNNYILSINIYANTTYGIIVVSEQYF